MIQTKHSLSGRFIADMVSGPQLDRAFRRICFQCYDSQGCSERCCHATGYGLFDGLILRTAAAVGHLPLLLVANHFSWWDGFIQHRLNKLFFHRRPYVMMLEEQLRKHPVLTRCGAFSVRHNSRDIIRSLNYAVRVLDDPRNMLVIFPQGRIESVNIQHVAFQSGVDYIMRHVAADFAVVMNANIVDYGPHSRPSLKVCFDCRNSRDFSDFQHLEHDFNIFYNRMKSQNQCCWMR